MRRIPGPQPCIEQFDDPGPHLLVIGGCVLWVRGYPDRARRAVADAIALGHRGGHHLSTAHAVHLSGHLAELMDDWDGVRKANETTMALATEWGLSGLRHQVSLRERLVAVAVHDDPEQMEYKRRHPQPGFARPLHDGVLARAYGRRGAPEEGLQVIEGILGLGRGNGQSVLRCRVAPRPRWTAPAACSARTRPNSATARPWRSPGGKGHGCGRSGPPAIWRRCCVIRAAGRRP